MTKNYEEWMILALYDELEEDKKAELYKALAEDETLKEEFKKMQSLMEMVSAASPESVDELEMSELRGELRARVQAEKEHGSFFEKFFTKVLFFIDPPYRPAFASILFLILGFGAGYFLFSSPGIPTPEGSAGSNNAFTNASLSENGFTVQNLRFIDNDASDGNIEFSCELVKPVRFQGSVNDKAIQEVLLHSVLSERNPGARLQSVNIMNEGAKVNRDDEVKNTLIKVLKFDKNPGVRHEAVQQLGNFNFDDAVKDAYIYAVQFDENNGIRIEAMNRLVEATQQGYSPDSETLDILEERSQNDEVQYIRTKAKTIVEEYTL